jgi:hypothetical protein
MKVSRRVVPNPVILTSVMVAGLLLFAVDSTSAEQPAAAPAAAQQVNGPGQDRDASVCEPSQLGSPYIPVDSWVYPAVWRLYALGYLDTVYLGMRPYTRASLQHMLEQTEAHIQDGDPSSAGDEAQGIYESLSHELQLDEQGPCGAHKGNTRLESIYSIERGISGTPLRDSFHLGSTIINDYARPYQAGFNDYSGASGYASAGRFQIYARGEFQGAPSGAGYSTGLSTEMASIDATEDFYNPTCWNAPAPLPVSCVPFPAGQPKTSNSASSAP